MVERVEFRGGYPVKESAAESYEPSDRHRAVEAYRFFCPVVSLEAIPAIGVRPASAVGIAISPLPLIAVILMLATPTGRANGIAFTAGWVLGLAAVVTVVVAVGSGLSTEDEKPTWTSWTKLALGVLFVLMAVEQ